MSQSLAEGEPTQGRLVATNQLWKFVLSNVRSYDITVIFE